MIGALDASSASARQVTGPYLLGGYISICHTFGHTVVQPTTYITDILTQHSASHLELTRYGSVDGEDDDSEVS